MNGLGSFKGYIEKVGRTRRSVLHREFRMQRNALKLESVSAL